MSLLDSLINYKLYHVHFVENECVEILLTWEIRRTLLKNIWVRGSFVFVVYQVTRKIAKDELACLDRSAGSVRF